MSDTHPNRPQSKRYLPWWNFGLQFLVCCFALFERYSRSPMELFYIGLIAFNAIVSLIMFVHAIVVQRPQFTLRTIFATNLAVALLCSLYMYIGKWIIVVLFALYLLAFIYALITLFKKKPDETV
jgi:hypothetical protein